MNAKSANLANLQHYTKKKAGKNFLNRDKGKGSFANCITTVCALWIENLVWTIQTVLFCHCDSCVEYGSAKIVYLCVRKLRQFLSPFPPKKKKNKNKNPGLRRLSID